METDLKIKKIAFLLSFQTSKHHVWIKHRIDIVFRLYFGITSIGEAEQNSFWWVYFEAIVEHTPILEKIFRMIKHHHYLTCCYKSKNLNVWMFIAAKAVP